MSVSIVSGRVVEYSVRENGGLVDNGQPVWITDKRASILEGARQTAAGGDAPEIRGEGRTNGLRTVHV